MATPRASHGRDRGIPTQCGADRLLIRDSGGILFRPMEGVTSVREAGVLFAASVATAAQPSTSFAWPSQGTSECYIEDVAASLAADNATAATEAFAVQGRGSSFVLR